MLADHDDLLLRLYRLAHDQPVESFQDRALELLKPVLPFDSAMWGAARMTAAGIDIHTIHLHRQPAEMLQEYEAIKHLDTAAQAVTGSPRSTRGFDVGTWFNRPEQQVLRDYGKRFEQAHFFISGMVAPATGVARWLSLFRARPDAHCMEVEQRRLARLMPHMQQALELNRLGHLSRLQLTPMRHPSGRALANGRGMIQHMDPVFEEMMRNEWEQWKGPVLPEQVLAAAQRGATRLLTASMAVILHAEHGMLWMRVRVRCPADSLSPREHAVAQRLAAGLTHKEIAARLQRSPATVRNQIRSIYDKLAVGNVAALIKALRQAE